MIRFSMILAVIVLTTIVATAILTMVSAQNMTGNMTGNATGQGNGQNTTDISPFPSPSFQSKAAILDNMPSHNVTVGDIDIAYKQIGRSDAKPIILITGASATMDMWNPLLLEQLTSANYRVIIFENRGVGESTVGTKEFSISQFANDTWGLLDALGISKADVLGWSMGEFIAQQLALTYPDNS
jgi:hypothetical protein